MPEKLHHAILGPGGIGGLMAASLVRTGASVTMVVRPESLADYPEKIGLESPFGDITTSISRAAKVPACDVLWITVKATQLEASLRSIVDPESVRTIVPLLNGIDHLAFLRERYRREKVIAATIAVESERVSPGRFMHRSPFVRLSVHSCGESLLGPSLDQLHKLGFECRFIADEATLMWGKLVFLAPFALTTTASNQTTGQILADSEWRQLGLSCIREVCAVAVAEGAKLDAEAVIAGAMKMPGNMRSSMQKDVEQGKPAELEAIAGPILRAAYRHEIGVPATEALVAAVKEKVAEKTKPLAIEGPQPDN